MAIPDWLKRFRKNTFQAINKGSAILGSPFLVSPTANLLMKEREKITQGNRNRGYTFPMNTVKYDPKLDKSNVPNKPPAQMVSKIPTNKGYTIKLGQKPKKINKNPPKLKTKKPKKP